MPVVVSGFPWGPGVNPLKMGGGGCGSVTPKVKLAISRLEKARAWGTGAQAQLPVPGRWLSGGFVLFVVLPSHPLSETPHRPVSLGIWDKAPQTRGLEH